MDNLDWLDGIEMTDLLDNDSALIVEHCGLDTMKKLWLALPSMNLYISTKPLSGAKKRYICKHYDGTNIKALAKQMRVSERFVIDAINEKPKKQSSLF